MNKITNHLPTAELQALDAAHHMHPFTANAFLAEKGARVITRATGVTLTDSEGEQILDAMAGLWCVNIGYGRDELADVAYRQMKELPYYNTFFMSTHVPAIALADKVAELAPGNLNHVFFASGGSEANDTNIRLVRTYWQNLGKPSKQIIIGRNNAYHGSTLGATSLGGMKGMQAQGGLLPGFAHIGQPHWYLEGGDMSPEEFGLMRARELEAKIAELGEENVAAFIAEPVQGAGGVIVPPDSYWPEIQRICDAHDILLIVDEVITGFGRTGEWFGTQYYGLRPDIITIAKGLSSGYAPIGGSVVSDHVAEVLGREEFAHGYTYSGHPVAAAVALENLRILEDEKIVDHVKNEAAPYLAEKWHQLGDHPFVGETKIVGMMASLALTADKSVRKPFESPAGTVGYMVREKCFANNLIMRHVGDRMIVAPPLVMTKADIDLLFERAVKSLDEGYAAVKEAGLLKTAG
ncbi:aspartate aminotransferase family protein [Sinisalibacter aestuarii]|uniref:Aspartate aminotransferase family protein n=1 Tax=Sinisalibacter aestuarii TaxID=2949426 RepID=A0ABQ5LRS8_9RHOB|nr:aspartate aminotransferase family protein [Sinisalibacter aestuarii]GKY87433.1 aspartate aminotransferase family protein [Sinisalibacter aestuarii]